MSDALFETSGENLWTPTELARGPWSAEALHGGPVAALLARLAESVAGPGPRHAARLTVELLRPVPLAPLRGRARVRRPGRKVELVEASLHEGGGERTEVACARLLRIRSLPRPLPKEQHGGRATLPPLPDDMPTTRAAWRTEGFAYHSHAAEHRIVRGSWGELGPCTDWIRLRVPVLAGEEPTPLQRVAAAADFGNGISSALPYGEWRFINPDLTIHLQRAPRGEWIGLDAVTWPEGDGVGLAESELFDTEGRIGRSLQSLLLEKA